MRLAPRVQPKRMAMAHRARSRVRSSSSFPAVPPSSPASSAVTAVIKAMLASRDSHWSATFPAMNFLLSLTVPISRLLIIMDGFLRLMLAFTNRCAKEIDRLLLAVTNRRLSYHTRPLLSRTVSAKPLTFRRFLLYWA